MEDGPNLLGRDKQPPLPTTTQQDTYAQDTTHREVKAGVQLVSQEGKGSSIAIGEQVTQSSKLKQPRIDAEDAEDAEVAGKATTPRYEDCQTTSRDEIIAWSPPVIRKKKGGRGRSGASRV
ncbi:hypothetical protein OIU78_001092 [Salix suchowensis]|nr:hypothetical protein OIU78_001092 [Salix suchowensis]